MCPDPLFFTEAQERYVLAVDPKGLKTFRSIAERERCGYSVRNFLNDFVSPKFAPVSSQSLERKEVMLTSRSGKVVGRGERKTGLDERLILTDRESMEHPRPIDLPMSTLFGKLPKLSRTVESRKTHFPVFDASLTAYLSEPRTGVLNEAVSRVLQLPAVASKMFLITIGVNSIHFMALLQSLRCFESRHIS